MQEREHHFTCPYCNEEISMLIDPSSNGQHNYIEDCEVCCRPIRIDFAVDEHEVIGFSCETS